MRDLDGRFQALGAALKDAAPTWREQPFYRRQPDWLAHHAHLADACLRLDDAEVEALAGDNARLLAWVGAHVPAWRHLAELVALPRRAAPPPDAGRAAWHVPGRKQAQIEAFAAAMAEPRAPLLEWCSGKGHLGRLLGRRWRVAVRSLELDPALIAAGEALAANAGLAQSFIAADALAPETARHLAGSHVVALHACGELHRRLARGAVAARAPALDLAPCCYYRGAEAGYVAFDPGADLGLSAADLHLAVTETATAGARGRRARDRAMARKLGFLAWHRDVTGLERPARFPPVPEAWNALEYADYARRLAARAGLAPTADTDWAAYARLGERRRAEVMRLSLPRLAFRRPLELWLALDLARFLAGAGYAVELAEFCAATLTPRNLLISARRND
jgi:hypothetical protein